MLPIRFEHTMVVGGEAAFEADATVWRSLLDNPSGHFSNDPDQWVMETVTRAHCELRGLRVQQEPFAYCIMGVEGNCRYPEHLSIASGLVPWLIELQPHLCGHLGKRRHCSSSSSSSSSSAAAHEIPIPQTLEAERADPGFCGLIQRCRENTSPRPLPFLVRRLSSSPAFRPLGRGCCRCVEGNTLLPWGSDPSPSSISGRWMSDSMNDSQCGALCAADARCDAYELNVSSTAAQETLNVE